GYPNQNKMGDYIGMVSDNTGADVAFTATFNLEEDVYFARIPAVNQLPPDAFALVRGVLVSGSLGSLQWSDGNSLVAHLGPTVNPSESPLQLQLTAHSAVLSPTWFQVTLAAGVNTPGLAQTLSIWNYTTGKWVQVDSRPATTSRQTVTISAAGTLSDYVNQGNGEVKALVAYKQTGPTLGYLWQAAVDQVQWVIAP
ncbi:MAG TPA: hypothetical protein VKT78_09790, partial [Fimbriimonadaceae bacterium]|nr:hypothetical protein [Fimbriimonadaceae bacterium]